MCRLYAGAGNSIFCDLVSARESTQKRQDTSLFLTNMTGLQYGLVEGRMMPIWCMSRIPSLSAFTQKDRARNPGNYCSCSALCLIIQAEHCLLRVMQ